MIIRMDKFLADMGYGSRSDARELIRKSLVSVNGHIIKSASVKIDTDKDEVVIDGIPAVYTEFEYYLLNKPAGVVSATKDDRDKTVVSLIEEARRKDLFPVGRLDKDTEGLLLITNDGELSHALLSPKKHVEKTYYVETDGMLSQDYVELFKKGFKVDEELTALPSKLEIISASDEKSRAYLTIHEGKFHQVKRMMESVSNKVTYLKRISMGPLRLTDDLKCGEYRKLTQQEIKVLKNL